MFWQLRKPELSLSLSESVASAVGVGESKVASVRNQLSTTP
jgi:hypothetical protein